MTILSANKVPLGLRGLAIFLIGIGGLYLTLFISYVTVALGENAANYGVTASNLSNYLTMDVVNYLMPAIFALSASYALFSQKKTEMQFLFPGGRRTSISPSSGTVP